MESVSKYKQLQCHVARQHAVAFFSSTFETVCAGFVTKKVHVLPNGRGKGNRGNNYCPLSFFSVVRPALFRLQRGPITPPAPAMVLMDFELGPFQDHCNFALRG